MTQDTKENEYARHKAQKENVHLFTNYKFLAEHNGLRRGNMHLILGTSGGGKSTLVKSLVDSLCTNNDVNVGVVLSEEILLDYLCDLHSIMIHDHFKKIKCISELEKENYSKLYLQEWLVENRIEVLIYDNITTSKLYMNVKPGEQGEFAKYLKELAQILNIPIIVIAHTDASIRTSHKLIVGNDIRGSKNIINLTEFLYIIQKFEVNSNIYQYLYMEKHRGYQPKHKLFYLNFDRDTALFKDDDERDFMKFKEIFKQRNQL